LRSSEDHLKIATPSTKNLHSFRFRSLNRLNLQQLSFSYTLTYPETFCSFLGKARLAAQTNESGLAQTDQIAISNWIMLLTYFQRISMSLLFEKTKSAFHSTKNSGMKFRVFHVTNGTVFSGYSDFPEF